MTRHGGSKKKGHRGRKPHVSRRAPAPARKRSLWWLAAILPVIVAITILLWWRTAERPESTAPPAPAPQRMPQLHISAVLDAHAGRHPGRVSDIQAEELALTEALTEDFPRRDTPLALLATVHQYLGDTTKAEALWKQAVGLNPRRSDLYEKLGEAAQRKDELDEAVAWWRKGLEANPRAPGLRWEIANARITQGQLDDALTLLQEECSITPQAARNHYLLGQVYLKQRAYEEAKAAYEKALEIEPGYYNAHYGLGMACMRLKEREQAQSAMARFKELRSDAEDSEDKRIMIDELPAARRRAAAFYGQAYGLYHPQRQAEIGRRLLARALELDPNNAYIWEKLAGHHYANQRPEQALAMYRKAAALAPDNPVPHINIGKLYALMNQPEQAERALQQAVTRFPSSGLAHSELALLYLRGQRRADEAVKLMQKAVALAPTANHYYLLTWAYDVAGDPQNALAAIEKALALEPQNERYRSTHERIRSRL
jgi:tetratricopeptide (TPR) repeat protein